MAGDYTRFTFKPQRDYSGVFKQQGRVDLDADFNELIEIIDRRWRSETLDIVNHCVVPNTTPDAFLVTPTGMGAFDIGIGRMYVDGIQVENHGLPPLEFQSDLGNLLGTNPVPYDDQPYLPAPLPPVLAATPNTDDLVYIDVWQREVTVLEDPSLREIALGGPDTTTRIQSVWQVRALQDVGPHGCGDDIPAWDALTAPSAGRLTTSAVAPPASDDPCIISPAGGYRGLENRLYRVEIHSTGPIGGGAPAKFKWSRNNATIASSVSAIPSTTQVTVQQVGRDQVLRFEVGNFIEITDDFREFQGLTGHMAQITAIDEANRILDFTPAIPAAMNFNAADPSRHTRVRRWDQTQNVDANGLLDVTAGLIDIEDGIQVNFSLSPLTGNFKVGDFWVFAARTADGSVELLQNAPPRGILHHYCRLGFIHWGTNIDNTTFTDCRDHWPHACECDYCTVTVGDGVDSHGQFTDIQQAINALGNRGGVVCIGRGFYTVTAGLLLNNTKRNVIIRGMGPATRILFVPQQGGTGVFLNIERTEQVRLENVFVVSRNAQALVRITESNFVRIEDCYLINIPIRGDNQGGPATRAVDFAGNCSNCEIVRSGLLAAKGVASTSGEVRQLSVRRNEIIAQQVSIFLNQAFDLEIVENRMRGLPREGIIGDSIISRATIDAFQAALWNVFRAAATPADFQAAGVLVLTANRIVISRNLITAQVAVFGFLFINARIEQNDIVSLIGMLLAFGLIVKFEDNFVLGLFAGIIHAGIIADLDCTSNEFLGINGIIWMSLAELIKSVGVLITTAFSSPGLGLSPAAINATLAAGSGLAGNLQAFGVAVIAKIHRNVFLTFSRGIFKSNAVVSADISIVDNTFSLCSIVAIELGGIGQNAALLLSLLPSINLRHLIQSNALAVRGRGIVSSSLVTEVEQNSIQCPSIAIELDAAASTARNNTLIGLATEESPPDQGLLILHRAARGAMITGNSLLNAPGHSILLRDDLIGLVIEDNQIQRARLFGIGTFTEGTVLRRSSISRNRVEQCAGDFPAGPAGGASRVGGAVVIGNGLDLRLIDNVIENNSPQTPGNQFVRWFAVYCENANGIEVSGNTITSNATVAGLGGLIGAIGIPGVLGVLRLQNNVVRDNGGAVLVIGEGLLPRVAQSALVQNNHFSGGPNPLNFFVIVNGINELLFQGNQCAFGASAQILLAIALLAPRANVSSNVVDFPGFAALALISAEALVNANSVRSGELPLRVLGLPIAPGPVRVVVTSNLATGIFANSTGALIRSGNFPPP
ncbi:MAG: right-handed parallel beta-helix repeat-containing protein [Pyrinomonadaceae bacterium]|nr:right-handed parallel beta-helix repeat-containing protein [Pyrinomonadaceae bacterium]